MASAADGALSKADKATVESWLEERPGGQFVCPACGAATWEIGKRIVVMQGVGAGRYDEGRALRCVVLTSTCGYVALINMRYLFGVGNESEFDAMSHI